MSKILYPIIPPPWLLVAPPKLVDTSVKVRAIMDQHLLVIDQATLARFITEGFFLSHVKRMRELYAQRRIFFIEQFEMAGRLFPSGYNTRRFALRCLAAGKDFPLFMRARGYPRPAPASLFFLWLRLS